MSKNEIDGDVREVQALAHILNPDNAPVGRRAALEFIQSQLAPLTFAREEFEIRRRNDIARLESHELEAYDRLLVTHTHGEAIQLLDLARHLRKP